VPRAGAKESCLLIFQSLEEVVSQILWHRPEVLNPGHAATQQNDKLGELDAPIASQELAQAFCLVSKDESSLPT
jgi:hypothetical protein